MSDIFNEVDDELRQEQFRKLWARYGNLILAVAFLVVAGVGGWRGYEWYQARKAGEAGAAFEAAVSLLEAGKTQEAQAAFAKIAAEGTPGYRTLARLRAAEALAPSDAKAAVAAFDAVANDTSVPRDERDLAALRAGLLVADDASYDDLMKRLEPLAQNGSAFRHTAREVLAFTAWRAENFAAARQWAEAVITDAETPAGIRGRVQALQALLPPVAKS